MTSSTSLYESSKSLYLGFDLSTQQLKIIVTNDALQALNTYHVEFDAQFKSKYGVTKGVLSIDNELEQGAIVSPVFMWLDSIDYVFGLMNEDEFPFDKVVGISGSCQQHGSVFWSQDSEQILSKLGENINQSLSEQLKTGFTFENSPNWQDHSTGKELKEFEEAIGVDELSEISGSRAHYRFTGLQIRKLATRTNPKKYQETWRISLVSSFVASILLGKVVNIEESDACGMNLYDIPHQKFNDELLALAAGVHPKIDNVTEEETKNGIANLKQKLGEISPITYENEGSISSYFQSKYGFKDHCKIYSFTGDNLATIISLPLAPNDCLLSLGTSTTVLIITKNYKPSSQYHLFKHPTMRDEYMGMICYCNGSLAREKIRDKVNQKYQIEDEKSWDKFNQILDSNEKFNNKLGIYFPLGEIVPNASAQTTRAILNPSTNEIKVAELNSSHWNVDDDVSSIVESQALSCRLRAGPMLSKSSGNEDSRESSVTPDKENLAAIYKDLTTKFDGDLITDGKAQTLESLTARPNRCFYVGGASNNTSIIKRMGSILGPVNGNYKVEIPNACALGGAYKASWSHECELKGDWIDYNDYINRLFDVNQELESFEVHDHWIDYFNGVGLLAKMEQTLKHD
ncbi:D-xylulokinase [Scheffersomyces coipomensis]|uniref:D-xylulokinase n=1 Tax=Scheffersomyces coipomensis TaxID=1788519 RepID=UPI00315C8951